MHHKCAKKRPRSGVKIKNRYINLITGLARTARALPTSVPWTLPSLLRLHRALRRFQIDFSRTTKAAPSFNLPPTCSSPVLPSSSSPSTIYLPAFLPPPTTPSMSTSSTQPTVSGLLSDVTDNVVCGTTNGHIQELLNFKKNTQCSSFIAVNRQIKNLCKDYQNKVCPYSCGHYSHLDSSYLDHYCQICYIISGGVCLDHSKVDCNFYKKKHLGKGKKSGRW